jgi:hypothetical protein
LTISEKCYIFQLNPNEKAREDAQASNKMKKVKRIIAVLLAVFAIAGLCACTPIEENIDTPDLKYDTQYPQTKTEYNLAVNAHLMTYLNYLETHIASGHDVLNGNALIANEVVAAKNSLAQMEISYAKMQKIYPPADMASVHASTLLQMKEAVNSLSVYIEYLEKSTDGTVSDPTLRADIEATIAIMQTEFTSLKNVFIVAP